MVMARFYFCDKNFIPSYNPKPRRKCLPKDTKNDKDNAAILPLLDDGPPSVQIKPFTPDQMIRCEECLRANGPTRVNCLYCGTVLPLNEVSVNLQKPSLRPLEKWEQGYNNILLPSFANRAPDAPEVLITLGETDLSEAADLLKLTADELRRILSFALPLPLARAATMDEALLIQRRLTRLRIDTVVVADAELGVAEMAPVKIRALQLEPDGFVAYQNPGTAGTKVDWSSLRLVVVGRLYVKRIEMREQKSGRAENRLLDTNEFFADEGVVELYADVLLTPIRIAAHSFDFSGLGELKRLVAGENFVALVDLIRTNAPEVEFDQSYKSARRALEAIWPSQQENEPGGWRRDRPGKYSIGSTQQVSNETQFQRYSRLRYFFQKKSRERHDEVAQSNT